MVLKVYNFKFFQLSPKFEEKETDGVCEGTEKVLSLK